MIQITNLQIEYIVAGAIGGLVATLVKCGYIELPSIRDRRIYLGGVQGVLFGIIAGVIGDNNILNAFVWGIGGTSLIQGMVNLAETRCVSAIKTLANRPEGEQRDDGYEN